MRKRQRAAHMAIVGIWCLITLGLAGCGGSGGGDTTVRTTRLRLQIVPVDQAGSNALHNAIVAPQTRAVPTDPNHPAFVARLDVQIDGEGITPSIQQSFPLSATQQTQAIIEIASVPPGPNRRITVDGFNTAGNKIFTGQATTDLLAAEVTVEVPVQRVFIPAAVTAADLANKAFTFNDGAAFGIPGEVTLTFTENTGPFTLPFTLTSNGLIADGNITVIPPATASTLQRTVTAGQSRQDPGTSCSFVVIASNYPLDGGPQVGEVLTMTPCEMDTIDGNLILINAATGQSSISEPPVAAPSVPVNTVRIGSPSGPVARDTTFSVPVEFNAGTIAVVSYLFELTFNRDVVVVDNIANGSAPFDTPVFSDEAFTTGLVRFAANNSTFATTAQGLLTLAIITFRVVGNSGTESALTLALPADGTLVNITFDPRPSESISFLSGSITVQ